MTRDPFANSVYWLANDQKVCS